MARPLRQHQMASRDSHACVPFPSATFGATYRQTDRQPGKQTDIHTDRQAGRPTGRQANRPNDNKTGHTGSKRERESARVPCRLGRASFTQCAHPARSAHAIPRAFRFAQEKTATSQCFTSPGSSPPVSTRPVPGACCDTPGGHVYTCWYLVEYADTAQAAFSPLSASLRLCTPFPCHARPSLVIPCRAL